MRYETQAARSAATFTEGYVKACCRHTEAVSECPHCNLNFLVSFTRRCCDVLAMARTPEPPPFTRERVELMASLYEAEDQDTGLALRAYAATLPASDADSRNEGETLQSRPQTPACNYCGAVYPAEHQKNCALLKFRPTAKERG